MFPDEDGRLMHLRLLAIFEGRDEVATTNPNDGPLSHVLVMGLFI